MTSGSLRWLLWVAALCGLGWLVATDRRQEPTPVVADVPKRQGKISSPQADPRQSSVVSVADLIPRDQLINQKPPGASAQNLFASRTWVAPAAPVPVTAPLPPPVQTPRTSFTYLGKRKDEKGWQVYLGQGELALIVREGDAIADGFRVESIKPPTLTLVGADGRQQIAIGEWE